MQNRIVRASIMRIGKNVRPTFDWLIAAGSRVGDPDVFEGNEFPWRRDLEAGWHAVRKEFEQIYAFDEHIPPIERIAPDHARIAHGLQK